MHGNPHNLCQSKGVKRIFAIAFCLLILWGQTAVSLRAALPAAARAGCACCDCAQTGCCVAPSDAADTVPPLALPVRSVSLEQFSLPVSTTVLWVVPEMGVPGPSLLAVALLQASGAPLYERNCALLI
jgi:hypothetical protein